MKTSAVLQLIYLGSLLIFNPQPAAAAGRRRCIDADQVKRTEYRLQKMYQRKLPESNHLQDARTCAQAAAEMRTDLSDRSLSPWRYRLKGELDRVPHEITYAECLCDGCIINQREDMSYNSVPVFFSRFVHRRTLCPWDPNKYMLKREVINIPVACTCVEPSTAK
ncbi:interleukin-17C-like isoform X2 [Plectropomus leopardus]|uniref:interleukin-17C-like isoform X2 n=1 Tax=Plectropomus leopardus TaxID=160734 RepID=UPI001C4C27A1|nr:interleukin-17C-like isoform X2 [Plectropomus leopardus]